MPIDRSRLLSKVKLSSKYQIVIPYPIRKHMDLHPGEEIEIMQFENRIELVPIKSLKTMRGFIKGIPNKFEREKDRL